MRALPNTWGQTMLDFAARIVLFPLLAWQGIKTSRSALKLPDAAGQRTGITGTGPELKLLIVGDSSAAGVGASHQDEALLGQMRKRLSQNHKLHWCVDAKTGATTGDTIARLSTVPDQKFDIVCISLGVNDITKCVPRLLWLRRYAALLNLLERKFDADVICISGIPELRYFPLLPQPLRWVLGQQAARFDRALKRLVEKREGCRFVVMDFEPDISLMSPDGFHPGPKIYAQWGRKVYNAIRRDVRELAVQRRTNAH